MLLVVIIISVFVLYKYSQYASKRQVVYDARKEMATPLLDIYRQAISAYNFLTKWYKSTIENKIPEGDVRNISRLINILDQQVPKAVSALENFDPIKQFDGFHRGFDCNGPNAIITCVKYFLDCYPEYTSTQEFSNAIACYQKMLNDIQVYNSFIYNYNSIVTSKGYDIVAPSGALKPLSVD